MAPQDALEAILDKIRQARNFDFRNYKRATLRRRVERRMGDRKCRTMAEYAALLDGSPEEYDALISGMLIKVTSFFRDPEAWDALRRSVLPALVKAKEPGSELRVWSVGCATGEETYSAALLLAEAIGDRADAPQVKVFGTDVDEGAIAFARRGIYGQAALQGVSKERLQRFFVPVPEGWAVRNEIRRSVVFGVNNLVSDAPISRLDLLVCRNVFIYLDASLQKRVLSRFHYALRPEGVLFLGKSELIPFAAKLFEAVDLPRRIYRRGERRDREVVDEDRLAGIIEQEDVSRAARQTREELAALGQFHRDLVNTMPMPVIATTLDGAVNCWNAAAARLWRRTESEVTGKRLTALGLAGLPGDLLLEKTAQVREGKVERRQGEGAMGEDGAEVVLSTQVLRLHDAASELVGLLYVVEDVTAPRRIEEELRQTREERQKAIEDLQTTNEELQSSNEELETTNEELQSANEELQTTNEELQSTNSELDATNRELAHRTDELNVMSFYQRTIIRSLSAAVIVIDPGGRITLWNLASERLFGITENEALGQTLWTLRIPVIGRKAIAAIRRALGRKVGHRIDDISYERAGGGRGHAALASVPLADEDRFLGGVVIVEDTTRAVQLAEERLRDVLERREARGRRRAEPSSA